MSMSIGDSNYHICWCFKKVYTDKKTTLLSDKALSRVLYIYIYIYRAFYNVLRDYKHL